MRRAVRPSLLPAIVLASLLLPIGPATATDPPSLRLFAADSRATAERYEDGYVYLDPGIWIAAVGGAFELRATRPDYDTPVSLTQQDATTGRVLRTLPAELLEGWYGLRDFIHFSVRDADGEAVIEQTMPFCPNSWSRSRVSDEGPLIARYPLFCGGNPFTRGAVWGIDRGWAVSALGDYAGGFGWEAPRKHYTVRISIDPAYLDVFGIDPQDSQASVRVTVVDGGGRGGEPVPIPRSDASGRSVGVPIVTEAPPDTLPDLIALPAWGIGTFTRRGRDFLAFNATEWNAGPGTLLVEGFRDVDEDLMDAYQYFLRDGRAVGRARIGVLEFHRRHYHWHFQQFTEYSLVDADGQQVMLSGKRSWCLANTDAIDLAVPNANWAGWGGDLFTMCGGPGAMWIREILDVGWGDTYSQSVAGQAFDITDVPNGTYFVRVRVNPTDAIVEGSMANNVEDRLIRIKGRPGQRRVVVPPWHGIDS